VREPELSVLLFRRLGWTEREYFGWSRRLLDEQVAFCLPTCWKSEVVARLVFLHPATTIEMVDQVLASME
jgi:aromatic-L-amino-acid/L-tryptophan decarboxylase